MLSFRGEFIDKRVCNIFFRTWYLHKTSNSCFAALMRLTLAGTTSAHAQYDQLSVFVPRHHHRLNSTSSSTRRDLIIYLCFFFSPSSLPLLPRCTKQHGGSRSHKMKKRYVDANRLRKMKKLKITEKLSER